MRPLRETRVGPGKIPSYPQIAVVWPGRISWVAAFCVTS